MRRGRWRCTAADGSVHLAGSFGVFDAGELRIAWRAARTADLEWARKPGAVGPLQPVILDHCMCCAAGRRPALELYVIAEGDGSARASWHRNKSNIV